MCNFFYFIGSPLFFFFNGMTILNSERFQIRQQCTNRRHWPRTVKRTRYSFVGRLVKEKRVDCLLRIWKITQPYLSGWEFIIVGRRTEKKRLHSLSDNLRLSNIRFEGFKNPSIYYQESKILLLCSKMEGWGMVIAEAIQYGCVPVCLDSFSSLKDIIDHEEKRNNNRQTECSG